MVVPVMSAELRAQQDTARMFVIFTDTVYTGKYYYILLSDKSDEVYKLLGVDNTSILVLTEGNVKKIDKNDIIRIKDYSPSKYSEEIILKGTKIRNRFYLGTGFNVPFIKNNNSEFTTGIHFLAGMLIMLDKYSGLRCDLDYMHVGKKDYLNESIFSKRTETGGSLNNFSLRFNLLFGSFNPDDNTYYFSLAAGIGQSYTTDITVHSENYFNGTNYVYDHVDNGESRTFLLCSIGAGINFFASPKIRLFVEPQYNILTYNVPNYFCLRAGIIL
jgi:hypothetical protein